MVKASNLASVVVTIFIVDEAGPFSRLLDLPVDLKGIEDAPTIILLIEGRVLADPNEKAAEFEIDVDNVVVEGGWIEKVHLLHGLVGGGGSVDRCMIEDGLEEQGAVLMGWEGLVSLFKECDAKVSGDGITQCIKEGLGVLFGSRVGAADEGGVQCGSGDLCDVLEEVLGSVLCDASGIGGVPMALARFMDEGIDE